MRDDRFERLCYRIFKFLDRDFGFKISDIKREPYGTYITYKNKTTAVKIHYAERDPGVIYVLIARLINGEVPPEPIFINTNSSLHTFDLEDLVILRSPSFRINRPPIEKLFDPKSHEKILKQMALALKKYAEDILRGNFMVFQDLERIVKKRAQQL